MPQAPGPSIFGGAGHIGGGLHQSLRQAGLFGLRAPGLALLETKQPATGEPQPDKRQGGQRN